MNNKGKFPDAPVPAGISGNLLSSVAPPSELPNFITAVPQAISSIPSDSVNFSSIRLSSFDKTYVYKYSLVTRVPMLFKTKFI